MPVRNVDRVFLVGPMGAGKSTVGRQLAEVLGWVFVDSDVEIERRCGANIPWIFDVEGESGFRDREEGVLEQLTQSVHVVLATGGGSVLRDINRHYLHDRGLVVYLCTSIEQQLERTQRDRHRPLLRTPEPEKVLRDLYAVRDPLYREVAHVVISTEGGQARDVMHKIHRLLHEH